MARQPRYLLNRNGRYFARLVIPKHLRPYLEDKTELREALGPDRKIALSLLHSAVSRMQYAIAKAHEEAAKAGGRIVEPGRYPLPVDQIALKNYHERLAFDSALRNSDSRYASVGLDDRLVEVLRQGIAGKLSDELLEPLVGERIERYRRLGHTTAEIGTPERRKLAIALCESELEAFARAAERDEGDYTGQPTSPLLVNAAPEIEELPPVPLKDLFERYIAELKANGKGIEAEKRWAPVIDDLIVFAKTSDARKITKKVLVAWKDAKIKTLSPRTVKDVYLTAVNAVFNWAIANDLLNENPAATIKLKVAAKALNRPKGFTRDEATKILKFALAYQAKASDNPQTQEKPQTSAAKKWAPLLCAFTGARISEITQLRKEDIQTQGKISFIRITPDAGKVKTRKYRDVPLHKQIIKLGFLEFVKTAPTGPLFYPPMEGERTADPAQTVSGRISNWLKKAGVVPEGVSPNHGWRHAFKTTGREAEIDSGILDAICGHSSGRVADDYGDFTIIAKQKAIDKLPSFDV